MGTVIISQLLRKVIRSRPCGSSARRFAKPFLRREGAGNISKYNVLPREFYSRETVVVARELLGKILVRRLGERILVEGRIVEAEAYRGNDDPASHAYRGLTKRNEVMFRQIGLAYIYFIYGNHYCLNVTARSESEYAGAVLIRALEPINGLDYMIRNRRSDKKRSAAAEGTRTPPLAVLTNGPGKLTQAMQISGKLNGIDMTDPASDLFIRGDPAGGFDFTIAAAGRVGISKGEERPWRFYIKENRFVSRR